MKRLLALSVALLILGLNAPASDAQTFGRNKIQYHNYEWHVLSTPHFDIHYYNGSEAFAARAGLVLEDAYERYSVRLKTVLPWRVPVILYSNHSDFLETNVESGQLSEGVQAFAEPSRRRIVLPFTSSFKEFEHTAVHELAHVFTFNIVYNRMLDNVFTRNYLFPMPLWVAEGLAEYLAVGWDADSDMFIRDAVLEDYLVPFYAVGGFYVYKEGQALFNYIEQTYGREKVNEFLQAVATTRSADAALHRTLGLSADQLYDQWSKSLRKHYWPLYPDKQDLSDIGRRLTDHVKDHGYYNTKPILSPDGESIVFFSDRSGFIEIYVMSALDGHIIRKVVSGSKSNRYESLHVLTSSMCFDPSGEKVAFIAKSSGQDALFVRNIRTGAEHRYKIDSQGLTGPTWNPVRDEIVLSATFHGQTDLLQVNLRDGSTKRLTNDAADQLTPRFFPDGRHIAFVYYPEVTIPVPPDFNGDNREKLAEIDFLSPHNVQRGKSYDIWEYDTVTGESKPLVESPGDDTEPYIMQDGKTIIYASDDSGVNNLYTGNIETRQYHRCTDVMGGVFTPSVHEEKGRIAFSAFVRGGWDVYVSDDLKGLLAHNFPPPDKPVLAFQPPQETVPSPVDSTTLATTGASDSTHVTMTASAAPDSVSAHSVDIDLNTYEPRIHPLNPPPVTVAHVEGESHVGVRGPNGATVSEDEPTFRGATVRPYHTRLAPDFIGAGGGLYFSSSYGFGIANSIALSDMLGDQHLMFAFSLYQNISQSDFLAAYTYLKRRADFSVGIYQVHSFLDSRVTSVGEAFGSSKLFSERNYGVFALMSLPFNKFYRMETNLQAYYSDRTFYDNARFLSNYYYYTPTDQSKVRLIEPSLAFVHDSAFYGPFGPVEGSRWRASIARGVAFQNQDVSRTTGYLDWRWYNTLFWRNSIAVRLMGAGSAGKDPRIFFLGGPTTLRGFDYQQFDGTRMWLASFEYRFPLFDYIIFGWPGRWGFSNIGGTVFFDIGDAWYNRWPKTFNSAVKGLQLQDAKADAGFGVYMDLGIFLTSFQFAWPTDLYRFDRNMQFHFWLGPTF
ncbi:MAG TPA: BamA/TamA family outer membrane protein [Candidatus Krumholzibacteria bacterium]|nr:BamA/TamA family outer membrane protein [Candidatus Krumholzibacteria bacterium]